MARRSPPRGSAASRFRTLSEYRVGREWARYEGNALRDLFRELRTRFLHRHGVSSGRVLDVGPGPGRFSSLLRGGAARLVLLDLSVGMLRRSRLELARSGRVSAELVRGDAAHPPFARRSFHLVAVLGNVLGYMPTLAWPSLAPLDGLVEEGGRLLLEIVPGSGERSAYLARLPPGAVARLLRSPVSVVKARVRHEGFRAVPARPGKDHDFRRHSPRLLTDQPPAGWRVDEVMAVAPALGFEPTRVESARPDAKAWGHLLQLEEELGRDPERWESAAAVLMALSHG